MSPSPAVTSWRGRRDRAAVDRQAPSRAQEPQVNVPVDDVEHGPVRRLPAKVSKVVQRGRRADRRCRTRRRIPVPRRPPGWCCRGRPSRCGRPDDRFGEGDDPPGEDRSQGRPGRAGAAPRHRSRRPPGHRATARRPRGAADRARQQAARPTRAARGLAALPGAGVEPGHLSHRWGARRRRQRAHVAWVPDRGHAIDADLAEQHQAQPGSGQGTHRDPTGRAGGPEATGNGRRRVRRGAGVPGQEAGAAARRPPAYAEPARSSGPSRGTTSRRAGSGRRPPPRPPSVQSSISSGPRLRRPGSGWPCYRA